MQQLEHQTLRVTQAEQELAAARATLSQARAGQQAKLEAARAEVIAVQAELTRSQAAVPVASLRQQLKVADEVVDRTVVVAPSDGEILKVIANPGETVTAQPILQMADTSKMLAIAEVYETDIKRVQVGDRARVESRALPEPLTGEVIHVGRVIGRNSLLDLRPTADADRRVAEVKVRLDDSDVAARFINMQVTVTIDLDRNKRGE